MLPHRPPAPEENARHQAEADATAHEHRDAYPGRGNFAKPLFQQARLKVTVIADHPEVPAMFQAIRPLQDPREKPPRPHPRIGKNGQGGTICHRERGAEAEFDSIGCNSRCRIYPLPAPVLRPDFRPGVRIILTHHEVIADRVDFTPLVAADHARRNAGCAHQVYKSARVVGAESGASRKPEFINTVDAGQRRWTERVTVRLSPDMR